MTDLRRKILDASAALVEEHGVRSVSFRQVARHAGVSHQAPYHHFGNYQGILRALTQEGFTNLARAMQSASDGAGPDPMTKLHSAGLAYVEFARTYTGHFRVMFQHAIVDIHDDDEPVGEAEGAHQTLVRLAQACHDSGYGHWMTSQELANLCWSTVHGVASLLVEGVLVKKTSGIGKTHEALTRQVLEPLTQMLRDTRLDP
ncbi:MAG: TetR/AcrR family transcriptional regulator [Myxococcota bacterium]